MKGIVKIIMIGILILLTLSGWSAQFQGRLRILVIDDFKNDKATHLYHLEQEGQVYNLKFSKNAVLPGFKSGDIVGVEGNINPKNTIQVKNIQRIQPAH